MASGESPSSAPPPLRLDTGSAVYAARGLSPAELAAIGTDALKLAHFAVSPLEVAGWAGMTKSALKRAMSDVRWLKLAAERQRRKRGSGGGGGGGGGGDGGEANEGDGGDAGDASDGASSGSAPGGLSRKRARPAAGLSAAAPAPATSSEAGTARRAALMASVAGGLRVAIDCSFNELMTAKERHSLADQIKLVWAAARRDAQPFRLFLTGLAPGGDVLDCLLRVSGFERWPLHVTSASYADALGAAAPPEDVRGADARAMAAELAEAAAATAAAAAATGDWGGGDDGAGIAVGAAEGAGPGVGGGGGGEGGGTASAGASGVGAVDPAGPTPAAAAAASSLPAAAPPPPPAAPPALGTRIVYLSADSPHVLTRLRADTAYVIGGLVDRDRFKGLTYARALAAGLPTARLPIEAVVTMAASRTLTTLHVVQLLLAWQRTRDWRAACLEVIPTRKGAVAGKAAAGAAAAGVAGGGPGGVAAVEEEAAEAGTGQPVAIEGE